MAQGKEMEAILKIVGNLDPSLEKAVSGATKAISGLGKGMAVIGGAAVAGVAAAGTAMVAASKAALDLGMAFDSASDTIRIGTGATGEALDSLNASFDEVYKSVPTDMDSAAQAIADFNTRLGLTGPELEGISEQAIQVSNMLGDDLGGVIEESSQAFQQWDIDASAMGDAMDYVFKASQSTGMGFTELMSSVQQFGPQMQELGFSFEEATALIGQMDKAGVNSSEVMGALKKSVGAMAKEGLSASEGLQQYITKIQEAGSMTEATTIAAEVFGSRAGSTMAAAIRDGSLSVADLTAELMASDETILKAAEDTEDFPQKLQKLKAGAQVALKPVANAFVDIANGAIPALTEGIESIMPIVTDVMGQIAPMMQSAADTILPMIMDGVQQIGPVIQEILPMVSGAISGIGESLQSFMPFVQEALSWVFDLIQQIVPVLMQVCSSIMPVIVTLGQSIFSVIQSLAPVVMEIVSAVLPVLVELITAIAPVIDQVLQALTPIIEAIGDLVSAILPPLMSIIEALIPIFTTIISIIGTELTNAFNLITPIIEGVTQVVTAMGDTIAEVFRGLVGAVTTPVNAIINTVNGIIDAINALKIEIPEWVPVFGGSVFSLNLAHIPTFAKGGFTEGISIAGEAGTEAVISFDRAYRSANLEYWMRAGKMLGALNTDGTVNSDSALAGKLLSFDDFSLSELAGSGGTTYVYDFSGMQYNTTINNNGDTPADFMESLEESKYRFADWLEEWLRRKKETSYA